MKGAIGGVTAATEFATFGAALRHYRRAASLTQEGLAARAGISVRTVTDLERGINHAPRRDTLRLLVQALALAGPDHALFQRAAQRAPLATRPPSARPRTNLPAPLTSFVGREREREEVRQALAEARLVTLTGAGGCGKTRLALRAAEDLQPCYRDGAWLVDLAALTDPRLVAETAAGVLGVRYDRGRAPRDVLAAALQHKRLLLVLDNCEHLADACAALAAAVLRACPRVSILATSRAPLGVDGERVRPLPPLALPEHPDRVEDVARSEAARLFIERARDARPGFALTSRSAPAIGAICRRLDGLPLALELAAARLSALSAEDLAARLDDRFALSMGGHATPPRQQTLRATLDWSYALLGAAERAVLPRLSVFAGGWTLDAAEALCADELLHRNEVAEALRRLVDESLVLAEDMPRGGMRYRLLGTVRQYAGELLLARGEAGAQRARHRAWYLALAERAGPYLAGPAQEAWLDLLEGEHDNLRAALAWRAGDAEGVDERVRLAAALWRFWLHRAHRAEGQRWLTAVRAEGGTTALRARVLLGRGLLAWGRRDVAQAAALTMKALALYRDLDDRGGMADALDLLGEIAPRDGG